MRGAQPAGREGSRQQRVPAGARSPASPAALGHRWNVCEAPTTAAVLPRWGQHSWVEGAGNVHLTPLCLPFFQPLSEEEAGQRSTLVHLSSS